jgi:hypothetical protein
MLIALNITLALVLAVYFIVPNVIQWKQYPAESGYSTGYRLAMVAGQTAVLFAIPACLACLALVLVHFGIL